jgi:hypothetical protein
MSNLNINNQSQNACDKLLNSIAPEEFYTGVLTRATVLNLYDKYKSNILALPLNENDVLRCLTYNFLRYINMSIQSLDVLLVLGLKNVSLLAMNQDIKTLISQLVNENKDTTDLYVIERILSQINNNLPHDLRGKFTPTHKQNIIKLLNNFTPFKDNLYYFKTSPNQLDNTTHAAESFTSLDNNYLEEMSDTPRSNIPVPSDYNHLKDKGYVLEDYLKSIRMNIDKGTYEEQLKAFVEQKEKMKKVIEDASNETSDNKLRAMYIDKSPELQYAPLDDKFYFYEHASGSLIDANNAVTVLNLKIDANKPKLSTEQKALFEKTLKKHDIPREKIDNAVKFLETVDVESEEDIKANVAFKLNNLKTNTNIIGVDGEVDVEGELEDVVITSQRKSDKMPTWAIIVIVVCVLVLLGVLGFLEYKYNVVSGLFTRSWFDSSANKGNKVNNYVNNGNASVSVKSKTLNKLKESIKGKLSSSNGTPSSPNNTKPMNGKPSSPNNTKPMNGKPSSPNNTRSMNGNIGFRKV